MECENCKSELPMHRLGCPEAKGETALYAKIEQLQAENKKLKNQKEYVYKPELKQLKQANKRLRKAMEGLLRHHYHNDMGVKPKEYHTAKQALQETGT